MRVLVTRALLFGVYFGVPLIFRYCHTPYQAAPAFNAMAPHLSFKIPQGPSNRGHKALSRGPSQGAGEYRVDDCMPTPITSADKPAF